MVGILDVLGLIAACIVVAVAILVRRRAGSDDREGTRGDLLRFAAVAAIAAFTSGLMYLFQLRGGGVLSLGIANAAMTFAPAVIWAACRRVNQRPASGMIIASAVSLLVLAVSFVGYWEAGAVKVAALAAFCALAFVESRRLPLRALPGAGLIAWTALPYAAYCVLRLVTGIVAGPQSWLWSTFFSSTATTVLGTAGVVALCIAVLRLARGLAEPLPMAPSRARQHAELRRAAQAAFRTKGALVAITLSTPDIELIRTAYGTERADAIVHAVEEAARTALSGAIVGPLTRTVSCALVGAEVDHHDADRAVRDEFVRLSPRIGFEDVPDLRITHRGITDEDQLDRFLGRPPTRLRQLWRVRAGTPALPR